MDLKAAAECVPATVPKWKGPGMADGINASARNTQARERKQQLDLAIAGLLAGQRQCHQMCTLGLPSGQEGLPKLDSAVHVNIH